MMCYITKWNLNYTIEIHTSEARTKTFLVFIVIFTELKWCLFVVLLDVGPLNLYVTDMFGLSVTQRFVFLTGIN